MQETTYRNRAGELQIHREVFMVPDDPVQKQSVMNARYQAAMSKVFAEGGTLESISQRRIGRNDPCPCGSGRKFKKCCKHKMDRVLNSTPE